MAAQRQQCLRELLASELAPGQRQDLGLPPMTEAALRQSGPPLGGCQWLLLLRERTR